MFGKDIQISSGGLIIGTKGINEYGRDVSSSCLADDPNLDLDTRNYYIPYSYCFSAEHLWRQAMYNRLRFVLILAYVKHIKSKPVVPHTYVSKFEIATIYQKYKCQTFYVPFFN